MFAPTPKSKPKGANAAKRNANRLLTAAAVTGAIGAGVAFAADLPADEFSQYVSKDGTIAFPDGFRQGWEHIGSWATAGKKGEPIGEMHGVYTSHASAEHFRNTGTWPDGAAIVKEVRGAEQDSLTTGYGTRETGVKHWFVMVRDQENRFESNPNWGDGWGWALFLPGSDRKNQSASYLQDCRTCHRPAKDTDWVFLNGYPVLTENNGGRAP